MHGEAPIKKKQSIKQKTIHAVDLFCGVKQRHGKKKKPDGEPRTRGVVFGQKRGPYLRGRKHEPEATIVQAPPIDVKDEPQGVETVSVGKVNARYINFTRGAQLVVGFEGDIFSLEKEEMELVSRMNDLLNGSGY